MGINIDTFLEFFEKYKVIIFALTVMVALIFLLKKSKKDGMNAKGEFDAEPDSNPLVPTGYIPENVYSEATYEENPIKMKYFKISEFDSNGAGESGTGKRMHVSTLQMLDEARAKAGVPFKINSGYRTPAHNKKVKGVSNSSHLYGYAADISATSEGQRNIILKALYDVGFRRFGVANTFIHVDNDPTKNSPAIWNYDGFKITFNPLSYNA